MLLTVFRTNCNGDLAHVHLPFRQGHWIVVAVVRPGTDDPRRCIHRKAHEGRSIRDAPALRIEAVAGEQCKIAAVGLKLVI